ncbi:hypothetical protein Q31b_45910 [Novipirellula aureliae]|uniref:Uncharacterized protein n=1 Tax=Novipirellula aureliae TaxID=2527966 RepID=A0A5C6DME3_9BACT|nr:hypothetical protein Q31b_45910 [Novipirellula aureliae]
MSRKTEASTRRYPVDTGDDNHTQRAYRDQRFGRSRFVFWSCSSGMPNASSSVLPCQRNQSIVSSGCGTTSANPSSSPSRPRALSQRRMRVSIFRGFCQASNAETANESFGSAEGECTDEICVSSRLGQAAVAVPIRLETGTPYRPIPDIKNARRNRAFDGC